MGNTAIHACPPSIQALMGEGHDDVLNAAQAELGTHIQNALLVWKTDDSGQYRSPFTPLTIDSSTEFNSNSCYLVLHLRDTDPQPGITASTHTSSSSWMTIDESVLHLLSSLAAAIEPKDLVTPVNLRALMLILPRLRRSLSAHVYVWSGVQTDRLKRSFALAKGLELKNALLQPRFVTALDRLFQTDWQSLASVRSSNKRHFSTIDLISPRMLPNKAPHSSDLASVHTKSNPGTGRDRSGSVDEPASNEATIKLSELKLNERETQAITATLTAAASAAPIPTPPLWLLQSALFRSCLNIPASVMPMSPLSTPLSASMQSARSDYSNLPAQNASVSAVASVDQDADMSSDSDSSSEEEEEEVPIPVVLPPKTPKGGSFGAFRSNPATALNTALNTSNSNTNSSSANAAAKSKSDKLSIQVPPTQSVTPPLVGSGGALGSGGVGVLGSGGASPSLAERRARSRALSTGAPNEANGGDSVGPSPVPSPDHASHAGSDSLMLPNGTIGVLSPSGIIRPPPPLVIPASPALPPIMSVNVTNDGSMTSTTSSVPKMPPSLALPENQSNNSSGSSNSKPAGLPLNLSMVQRKGEPAGVPKLGLGSVPTNQNAGKMKIALPLDQVSSSNNADAMESSRRSNRKPPLPPTGGNSGRASAPPSENATPVIGLNLQNMSVPLHSGQMQGAASVALNNTPRFANEAEQEAYMMKLLEDEEAFHSEYERKQAKMKFFGRHCSMITDNVFLGGSLVARDKEKLKSKGVTHVLNCAADVCPDYLPADFTYKHLFLLDHNAEDISCVFYPVLEWLEAALAEPSHKVFVHCHRGVSRSAAMVIAWLMYSKSWDYENTFKHVKSRRGITNPNVGFICQLLDWYKRRTLTWKGPWLCRVAPHCTRDLTAVVKVVDKIDASSFDSRGVFIACSVEHGVFIWVGVDCTRVNEWIDVAKHHVTLSQKFEHASSGEPLVIRQNNEPDAFFTLLSMTRPEPSQVYGKNVSYKDYEEPFVDDRFAAAIAAQAAMANAPASPQPSARTLASSSISALFGVSVKLPANMENMSINEPFTVSASPRLTASPAMSSVPALMSPLGKKSNASPQTSGRRAILSPRSQTVSGLASTQLMESTSLNLTGFVPKLPTIKQPAKTALESARDDESDESDDSDDSDASDDSDDLDMDDFDDDDLCADVEVEERPRMSARIRAAAKAREATLARDAEEDSRQQQQHTQSKRDDDQAPLTSRRSNRSVQLSTPHQVSTHSSVASAPTVSFIHPSLFEYPSFDRVDLFDCNDLCDDGLYVLLLQRPRKQTSGSSPRSATKKSYASVVAASEDDTMSDVSSSFADSVPSSARSMPSSARSMALNNNLNTLAANTTSKVSGLKLGLDLGRRSITPRSSLSSPHNSSSSARRRTPTAQLQAPVTHASNPALPTGNKNSAGEDEEMDSDADDDDAISDFTDLDSDVLCDPKAQWMYHVWVWMGGAYQMDASFGGNARLFADTVAHRLAEHWRLPDDAPLTIHFEPAGKETDTFWKVFFLETE